MVYFGHEESLSFFEEASFPVIFLNPDLTIKYMNGEADKAFSHMFASYRWFEKIMSSELYKKVAERVSEGLTATLLPPDIRDFSLLMFVPEYRKNDKTVCVKLYFETTFDIKRHIENTNDYLGGKLKGITNSAKLALDMLRITANKEPECRKYIEVLTKSCNKLVEFSQNANYLYEIADKRESSNETVFLLHEALCEAVPEAADIVFTDMTSDRDMLIYDKRKFTSFITGIISHYKLFEGSGIINIKAYTNGDRLVMAFRGERSSRRFSEDESKPLYSKGSELAAIRSSVIRNGGNMVFLDIGSELKILMSLKIHIKSEYGIYLRQ